MGYKEIMFESIESQVPGSIEVNNSNSLDNEIEITSYCLLIMTRLSLFEEDPLRVQVDAAPFAYKMSLIYTSLLSTLLRTLKMEVAKKQVSFMTSNREVKEGV